MNIDKLKQVIQKANPEIMELNVGCEVEYKLKKYTIIGMALSRWKMVSEENGEFSQKTIDYESEINYNTLYGRLFSYNMSIKKAFSTKKLKQKFLTELLT